MESTIRDLALDLGVFALDNELESNPRDLFRNANNEEQ